MNRERALGLNPDGSNVTRDRGEVLRHINLKLASLDQPTAGDDGDLQLVHGASDLLAQYRAFTRLLSDYLCPADERIQNFLDTMLGNVIAVDRIALPTRTLTLERHGVARELSVPVHGEAFTNEILSSYRTQQGVLHNPKSDRRTTAGVFHVADVGLPVPGDKLAVPAVTYARLLEAALRPPHEMLCLPFTAQQSSRAAVWVSLLLRPVVAPEVPGSRKRKTTEIRFFAPGGLVSNLDFVESIFGNAGDPYLPENDAGLDVEHWTGHTGCVILAPHIVGMKSKDLGLPHVSVATDRQKRDGMCYEHDDDRYNNANAFKIALRSKAGVMVTILADNYFGYCKKEVKTQISFSANLSGLAEEEHAGGALAFPSFNHGERFELDAKIRALGYELDDALALLGDTVERRPEGYAVDRGDPTVVYVPSSAVFDAQKQSISWKTAAGEQSIKLLPDRDYVLPVGYKLRYARHPGAPSWRLEGTTAEGTVCHKPCTVSGGGKSEISKSIGEAIVYGPVYVNDFAVDIAAARAIFERDYSDRFAAAPPAADRARQSRPVLSPSRSLGSVIKLLTPSDEYTPAYNAWLTAIPNHIRAIVYIIKRFYKAEWGEKWQEHFTVDEVNGQSWHELKLDGRKLIGSYLRMGFSPEGNWRLYKLRQDFVAAAKVQFEDDITASITVPTASIPHPSPLIDQPSVKLLENCEARLFQRPDDAVHPGLDKQTELDMSQNGLFASNYQPLTGDDARAAVESVAQFEHFSEPMKITLRTAAEAGGDKFVVCSARPRVVDGKLTKNPRYLQTRPDYSRPRGRRLAELGARLFRRAAGDAVITFPVDAVLGGRRNNPGEPGVRPLAVYNPIHYQELPELFMDFICSLTGKSPSTTGAGSEGALTKGPFNAIRPCADLNNAFVSYVISGLDGFTSAAGYVGPKCRVDHDVSLLIPELWCRLRPNERTAAALIADGCLERIEDFEHEGKRVLASRLGWRITAKFVGQYFGRIFDNPRAVFPEEMLRPETQDLQQFVDGVENIVEAQQRVAKMYFDDNSVADLCPPLQAIVHVMAHGHYNGAGIADAGLRAMFTKEHVVASDWYRARLARQVRHDEHLHRRHADYLAARRESAAGQADVVERIDRKAAWVASELSRLTSPEYARSLEGTIGADPIGAEA
jgi:hypothetical protein